MVHALITVLKKSFRFIVLSRDTEIDFDCPLRWIGDRKHSVFDCQRFLHHRQESLHPPIIAGCLLGQVGRFNESKLGIGFDRDANVLCPVFFLARNFLGRHGEVVEEPPLCQLRFGKMVDDALHVGLPVPESAHHIRIVAYPEARCIRRAISTNLRPEHIILGDTVLEELLDPRIEHVKPGMTAAERRFLYWY